MNFTLKAMKPRDLIHILASLLIVGLVTSCVELNTEDPADRYTGTYSYSETYYAKWGSASDSCFSHTGTFTITKQSSDRVHISNPWNTSATAMPTILSIDPVTQGDASGSITYTFISATLVGNLLTITYQGVGSLRYSDGRNYPYSCHGTITATKQ